MTRNCLKMFNKWDSKNIKDFVLTEKSCYLRVIETAGSLVGTHRAHFENVVSCDMFLLSVWWWLPLILIREILVYYVSVLGNANDFSSTRRRLKLFLFFKTSRSSPRPAGTRPGSPAQALPELPGSERRTLCAEPPALCQTLDTIVPMAYSSATVPEKDLRIALLYWDTSLKCIRVSFLCCKLVLQRPHGQDRVSDLQSNVTVIRSVIVKLGAVF